MQITLLSEQEFKLTVPLNVLPQLSIDINEYILPEMRAEIEVLQKLLAAASRAVLVENKLIVVDDYVAKLPPLLTKYFQVTRVSAGVNFVAISFGSFLLAFRAKTSEVKMGRRYELSYDDFMKICEKLWGGLKIHAIRDLQYTIGCRLLSAKLFVELMHEHLPTAISNLSGLEFENERVNISVQDDTIILTSFASVEFESRN